MSTEADIVERKDRDLWLRCRVLVEAQSCGGWGDDLVDRDADRLYDFVTAERDAAARDMRERCAKVADDYEGDGLEGGYDRHLGDAFETRRDIAQQIRALPDSVAPADPVVATEGDSHE